MGFSSMVAHLHEQGLLGEGNLFVEFGAGRGFLSEVVHFCSPTARHLLVDRQTVRRKVTQQSIALSQAIKMNSLPPLPSPSLSYTHDTRTG